MTFLFWTKWQMIKFILQFKMCMSDDETMEKEKHRNPMH